MKPPVPKVQEAGIHSRFHSHLSLNKNSLQGALFQKPSAKPYSWWLCSLESGIFLILFPFIAIFFFDILPFSGHNCQGLPGSKRKIVAEYGILCYNTDTKVLYAKEVAL